MTTAGQTMQTCVQPYLFFGGRCEEALAFYKSAIGAEIQMMMRFNEAPEKPPEGQLPKGFENKIMHASFAVGESTLMASDGCGEGGTHSGYSLSLNLSAEDKAKRAFAALSEGGSVTMPLSKTFWSPCFGMLTDKFGVAWMVHVPGEHG